MLSDEIKVRITSNPGETFLDRMIKLVEGASRQKTPNEIALNILLAGLTIIFLLAVVTLQPFAIYSGAPQTHLCAGFAAGLSHSHNDWRLALRHRHCRHGPHDSTQRHRHVGPCGGSFRRCRCACCSIKPARSRSGNRAATQFFPAPGVEETYLADAAQLSSLADETPEGRSIVVLAKERYKLRGRDLASHAATFIPFSAQTRMSGVDIDDREIRKGALEAISRAGCQPRQRYRSPSCKSPFATFRMPAARRCSWLKTAACWAPSRSPTS